MPIIEGRYVGLGLKWPDGATKRVSRFYAIEHYEAVVAVVEKDAKVERIEVRLSQNAKALLVAAAQGRHTSVSEFLLARGLEAAEQVVAVPRVFYASERGWSAIRQLLDDEEVQQPDAETISWLTTARQSI